MNLLGSSGWPRSATGAPEKTDLHTRLDPLAHRDGVMVHMTVESNNSTTMVDLNDLAIVAPVAGIGHDPQCSGINRRHKTGVEVEPAMEH